MSTHSHIYSPASDSLEARIEALKGVLQAFRNIKLSKKISGDVDWVNRLGTSEELEHAEQITLGSLKIALDNLSFDDLKYAKQKKLISDTEFNEFKKLQAQSDLQSRRIAYNGNERKNTKRQ